MSELLVERAGSEDYILFCIIQVVSLRGTNMKRVVWFRASHEALICLEPSGHTT